MEVGAYSQTAVSAYLPAGLTETEIESVINETAKTAEIKAEIGNLAQSSKNGAVVFWGEESKCLILPPFPVAEKCVFGEYNVGPLRSLLHQELIIGLVFVRLGEYAIGVFKGEELLTSKIGTGLVHSRHRKGGSSQRRFERHREKQIESFFTRVCGHVRIQLEPQLAHLDHLVYGGERNTLLNFRKQCSFLERFDTRTMGAVLNVRNPRQVNLKESIADIWSSELFEWMDG